MNQAHEREHPTRSLLRSRILMAARAHLSLISTLMLGVTMSALRGESQDLRAPVSPPSTVSSHGLRGARASATACAHCHSEITGEWTLSQHRTSWTDEVFQSAYRLEPMQFCRGCHAPLNPDAQPVPTGEAAHDGISCRVCHGENNSARAVAASEEITAQRARCGGCHQFNFPAFLLTQGGMALASAPMQDTFGEWQRAVASGMTETCQSCHMPWVRGPEGRRHRSHRFEGSRSQALLSSALITDVRATRRAHGVLTAHVLVRADHVGHAVPTGDVFRRLVVRVWLDQNQSESREIVYARQYESRYERDPAGELRWVRREVQDTRVQPPSQALVSPREVHFANVTPSTHTLHWRIEHQLMPPEQAASKHIADAVNRMLIREGEIAIDAANSQVNSNPTPPGAPPRG
ncbi:MAG: multiheme c-type cytochrome [Deltaproteobacteria bacterium]|nr:multiheme c-type cytochrome [Deltaproteobacteria bacterium]